MTPGIDHEPSKLMTLTRKIIQMFSEVHAISIGGFAAQTRTRDRTIFALLWLLMTHLLLKQLCKKLTDRKLNQSLQKRKENCHRKKVNDVVLILVMS